VWRSFRPYARTYANGEITTNLRATALPSKVAALPGRLYAAQELLQVRTTGPMRYAQRLGITPKRCGRFRMLCSITVMACQP